MKSLLNLKFKLLASVTFLTGFIQAAPSSTQPPTVTIKNGTYNGKYLSSFNQDLFLGMPFAQPPIGSLRFRNPVRLNSSWTGSRNATEYGKWCYGSNEADSYAPSEDCLTINVVRPSGYEGETLPVAAWIYGGGFFAGGSADPKYNLSYIVQQSVEMGKPMMALSMNYRVAAWGFLKSEDLVAENSTNMGMRDQRLALEWVQENIAAFGGNASEVTIWGESAGAFSVGFHLIAYGGRDDGLFRGAIAESGNPLYLGRPTWEKSQPYYDNVTALANCTDAADTLACLRDVPVEALDKIFTSTWTNMFFPQPDGDFIQGSNLQQLLDGDFVKVPLLNGANTDEGTAFLPYTFNSDQNFTDYVQSQGPSPETAETLLLLYPDIPAIGIPDSVSERPNTTIGTQYKRAAAYNGDYYFIAGRRFTAQMWSAHNVSTYSYRFNTIKYTDKEDFTSVTHGTELPFVFRITDDTYGSGEFAGMPRSYFDLADLMSRMWVSFVVDGTPNHHGVGGVPQWPAYEAKDGYGKNMVFDANVTSYIEMDTFRAEAIAYLQSQWMGEYGYNGCDDCARVDQ